MSLLLIFLQPVALGDVHKVCGLKSIRKRWVGICSRMSHKEPLNRQERSSGMSICIWNVSHAACEHERQVLDLSKSQQLTYLLYWFQNYLCVLCAYYIFCVYRVVNPVGL